jgi:GNAT superfamily N-acetyltransferase
LGAPNLREATRQDAGAVVDLITAMLYEMASHGGQELNDERLVRSWLSARFTESLEREDHVYLLAPVEGAEAELAGLVEASVVSPHDIFRPRCLMQVHSLYVQPRCRGQGVGRVLLEAALAWGRGKGCVEAKLNVLAGNPARALYASAGFEVFELEMRLVL